MERALKTPLRLVFPVHLCCLDMFGYQTKHAYSFLRYYPLVSGYCMKFYFCCFIYLLLCVWISDETLLLVFKKLPFSVWISQETLLLVFKKSTFHCYVWISEETLLLAFKKLPFSVWMWNARLLLKSDILLLFVWISDETHLLMFDVGAWKRYTVGMS